VASRAERVVLSPITLRLSSERIAPEDEAMIRNENTARADVTAPEDAPDSEVRPVPGEQVVTRGEFRLKVRKLEIPVRPRGVLAE
jgi:hypothetical protein